MTKISKEREIGIKVGLDEKDHPAKISWRSDDHPDGKDWMPAKGMMVSFFDPEYQDTYKIDLWTSEMTIQEMNFFIYHSLRGMADTFHRATNNTQLANDMQKFVQYFGEQAEVIKSK